ncbi:hypothetical protein PVAND_012640 [Polypedilum vanderplanki]|uniref:ODAD1 central coiled coil region domain-containing protein n=1 Tax=Polypedilum vanderplanki TaxID=319348 RepID=A0A9J6CM42_POLVA|nr:hypothetical protein PVAND_012640 [Polypedilum vanderplanki]
MADPLGGDQFDVEALAEAEIEKLLKQYRTIEAERLNFIELRKKSARKYNKVLNILEKEKSDLQFQLDSEQKGSHARRDSDAQIKILNLMDKKEKTAQALQKKKSSLMELEAQIQKLHKEIAMIRDNEITESIYKETICEGRKSVLKLENRLDVITKRCGSVMAENSKLRDLIDHMLQERSNFNVMWQRMINKLNYGKRHILELVEQATNAFDQREELCTKLQILKERGQNDRTSHVQEMRELQRKLDHDAKLQEFLAVKGQQRLNTESEEREADKKKKRVEQMEKQLQEYDKIFQRINSLSGEKDVDKIISKFIKEEEENYALFNYVNELSHEIEQLNETVQQLQDSIDEHKELQEQKKNSQDDNIDVLKEEAMKQKQYADDANDYKNECEARLQEILRAVEKLYKLLKCDEAPILYLLGKEKQVSINNAKLFLGIVDRKISQMINNLQVIDASTKILGKKDRIPAFNVKDSAKSNKN